MSSNNKEKKHTCDCCKKTFESYKDLERHNWTCHPKNEYEIAWQKHELNNWKGYTGSTYYQSDPYY